MGLCDEDQRREYQRSMGQMAIDIGKMRAAMRSEARKFFFSALPATAALVGAGAATGDYLPRHEPPAPPPRTPRSYNCRLAPLSQHPVALRKSNQETGPGWGGK